MVIDSTQAKAALEAAFAIRSQLPERLRARLEALFRYGAGALDGSVPKLRFAHLYPGAMAQPPSADEAAAEEAWQLTMTALAVVLRHLFDVEIPRERATLSWLGILSVNALDAERVVRRARERVEEAQGTLDESPIPPVGELPDPYDDPNLALVAYLRDQARLEECEPRVGPAEVAMTFGPEPLVGPREAFGLSFLRWQTTARGIEALARCRVHALSHQGWVLVVPEAARVHRRKVHSYIYAMRSVFAEGACLSPLRHLRPERPQAVARLLERLFSPSPFDGVGEGDAIDFEQRLPEARYWGGIVPELERAWLPSPFRRVEREAGGLQKAMELVSPTILEVAREQFPGDLVVKLDLHDECFEIWRLRTVVDEVTDPVRQIAASDEEAKGEARGKLVETLVQRVRTESWQP